MNALRVGVMVGMLSLGATVACAHEEQHGKPGLPAAPSAAQAGEQTLTGEVVDVVCYLSHGREALGASHAGCAKKCIQGGLPVAIKVGDQLYLAAMGDHTAANAKLADLAGQQVTVRGTILEQDGQHLIAITKVEKTQ